MTVTVDTTKPAAGMTVLSALPLSVRLALRELRGGLRGFYVLIACIALGVAAIGGVGSVARAITAGLQQDGQAILGGDLSFSFVHQPFTLQQTRYLETLGKVSEIATLRAMARVPDANRQSLAEVKAVDSAYPLFGTLDLEGAEAGLLFQKVDDIWPVVVERELLARLGLNVGDTVSLGQSTLKIAATINREPDRLGGNVGFGPRLLLAQKALDETGLIQPGSLIRYHARVRFAEALSDEALKARIEAANKAFPDAGWRIRSRVNAAPGLQANIRRFSQFLTLVGLTALIVGGVGIANAVRAFLEQKQPVIATMKSVGATGGLVVRVYLIQILILSTLGVALGLVIGALVPLFAQTALEGVLPVSEMGIYPSTLIVAALFGYLTALVFALWPLGRAHDVPVSALFRDLVAPLPIRPRLPYLIALVAALLLLTLSAIGLADDKRIAVIFTGGIIAAFIMLRLVAWLIMRVAARVPRPRRMELRLAVASLYKPGALTPSVILSLGLGLSLLVALSLLDANLRRQLSSSLPDEAPSFFFVDIQSHEIESFTALVEKTVPNVSLERVPMLRGRLTSLKGIPARDFDAPPEAAWVLRGDRGITYSAELPESSSLVEGSWWLEDYSGEPLVSFDHELAAELGLTIGDRIEVNVLGRTIGARIGNLRRVDWESMGINFVMVFSPNTFAGAPHAFLATASWPDAEEADEFRLLQAVTNALPTVTSVRVKDALQTVNDLVGKLAVAVRAAASVALIASVLVLGGALAAGHQARVREAVVLKVLGATRRRLLGAYLVEYALLGAVTALFALLAGGIAAWFVISDIMGFDFVFDPTTALSVAVIALGLTVSLGLTGTWRSLGQRPAAILRNL
ncbi:ABC transporter permease [Coralliovum pocilloporae]|uniref:ABC transporter permease n=1 Tax=Coralliovum pocilloporae TaxID=3066369 RepID=UPI0033074CF7